MKTNLACCIFAAFLLMTVTTGRAQTIWNYFISDAGNGESLVTWDVTGSLTIVPGPSLSTPGSSLVVSVVAPGIFADTYSSDGTLQNLANPDGSYFALDRGDVCEPIVQYATDTAAGNGNDSFGLSAPLPPKTPIADLVYTPGTQSVLIPVPFSDFNPGTYQSGGSRGYYSADCQSHCRGGARAVHAGVGGDWCCSQRCCGGRERETLSGFEANSLCRNRLAYDTSGSCGLFARVRSV